MSDESNADRCGKPEVHQPHWHGKKWQDKKWHGDTWCDGKKKVE